MGGEDLQFTPGTMRFFKVMMPGFTHKLNLPKKLYNNLAQEKSEQGIIKSSLGTCQIKVFRNQELGLISFEDGWPDFVHLHALCIGDFVVFEHLGNLHFNAFVFDQSACEKDSFLLHPKEEPQQKPQSQINFAGKQMEDTSDMSANTSFILTMKHCHANVYIPPKFWRSNGFQSGTNVILRDPRGRKWPVNLRFQRSGRDRCRMGRGWAGFYVGNKLKVGDVCGFQLIAKNSNNVLMDVHLLP